MSSLWVFDRRLRGSRTTSTTINGRNKYATFGGESLSYDRNGNLLTLHGTSLAYDFENHLRKATLPDGSTVENLYDPQGRKVEEKVTVAGTSNTRDYVLSGDQVVEEYQNGVLAARYVHGRGIDELVRVEQNANANQDGTLDRTLYPIQDELGNVERLTDANGQTSERYEYEGYGKTSIFDASGNALSASAYNWRWLFQGREYVSLLNAYDFRARHLWPDMGRFGQEDPAAFHDGLTTYESLAGSWVSSVDPSGLYEADVHYGLTYYIAHEAGFLDEDAQIIAGEDESVDRVVATDPRAQAAAGNWPEIYASHFPVSPRTGKVEEGTSRDSNPVAWAKVDAAQDLVDLGHGLHLLQDSFAHAGAYPGNVRRQARLIRGGPVILWGASHNQIYEPIQKTRDGIIHPFTQEFVARFGNEGALHAPDWTFVDPAKASRAARSTLEALLQYRVRVGALSPASLRSTSVTIWQRIGAAVDEFAPCDSMTKKRVWFEKFAPSVPSHLPWDDLTLDFAGRRK